MYIVYRHRLDNSYFVASDKHSAKHATLSLSNQL
jgi:hypothetical protein